MLKAMSGKVQDSKIKLNRLDTIDKIDNLQSGFRPPEYVTAQIQTRALTWDHRRMLVALLDRGGHQNLQLVFSTPSQFLKLV